MDGGRITYGGVYPEEFKFEHQLIQVDLSVLSSYNWSNQNWFFQRQHVALNASFNTLQLIKIWNLRFQGRREAKWTVCLAFIRKERKRTEFIDNVNERMWTASKTAQIFVPTLIFFKWIFPKVLLQMLINIYALSFVQLKKLYSILRDFFFPVLIYFISQESASAPSRGTHVTILVFG